MSFSLTVAVKDGQASVTMTGEVPDGEFQVQGHDDAQQRSFGATQRSAAGRYVAAANSTHYKEQ